MALQDGLQILGFAKGIRTDTGSTDAATITLPHNNNHVLFVIAYGASGDNSTATLGVFTAAAGGGTAIVANAALTTHTTSAINSARTVAAAACPVGTVYVRVGTASGVADSTINLALVGLTLP